MGTTTEHTHVIDGVEYTTKTLAASDGLRILPKIVALLADEKDRDQLLRDPKVLGAMITEISRSAAEDDGLLVLKDLLKTTTSNLVRIGDAEVPGSVHTHFDHHFAGRYRHLVEVCMWVGRVNFTGP